MKRGISSLRRTATQLLAAPSGRSNFAMPYEAFEFLAKCSNAKIDMTSAVAIDAAPDGILRKLRSAEYTPDYGYLARGRSRGEKFVLTKCSEFLRSYGINCTEENISMVPDILSAISQTYEALEVRNGKKVLVPTPTFGYYFQQFEDKKMDFEVLPTEGVDNFLVDPSKLESALDRTGAQVLLLCYPNNPTGAMMTEEIARGIADVTRKKGVFVISDEVFLGNRLSTEKKHFPIAAVDGMLDTSLTISSVAKMMGFAGIRTGFCVGSQEMVQHFAKLGGYRLDDQRIIEAALGESEENTLYLESSRLKYLANIEIIKEAATTLNKKFCEIFGEEKVGKEAYVKPYISDPEAGNVYLLDFSGLRGKSHKGKEMGTGLDVAKWLLEDASVGTVPGECYMFHPEEMLVRIALGHPAHEIEKAFKNIISAAERLSDSPSKSPSPEIVSMPARENASSQERS